MGVYDYEEHFHFLIAHHLLVYANIYTILLNHDWLMAIFMEDSYKMEEAFLVNLFVELIRLCFYMF